MSYYKTILLTSFLMITTAVKVWNFLKTNIKNIWSRNPQLHVKDSLEMNAFSHLFMQSMQLYAVMLHQQY